LSFQSPPGFLSRIPDDIPAKRRDARILRLRHTLSFDLARKTQPVYQNVQGENKY